MRAHARLRRRSPPHSRSRRHGRSHPPRPRPRQIRLRMSGPPSSSTTPPTRSSITTPPAVELWEQMEARMDAFVAGVGTGGTFSGIARFLKEQNPAHPHRRRRNPGLHPSGRRTRPPQSRGHRRLLRPQHLRPLRLRRNRNGHGYRSLRRRQAPRRRRRPPRRLQLWSHDPLRLLRSPNASAPANASPRSSPTLPNATSPKTSSPAAPSSRIRVPRAWPFLVLCAGGMELSRIRVPRVSILRPREGAKRSSLLPLLADRTCTPLMIQCIYIPDTLYHHQEGAKCEPKC